MCSTREANRRVFWLLVVAFSISLAHANGLQATPQKPLTTPGLVREFPAPLDAVREAVIAIQRDHILHGTLIFDKEPVLTGAEAVASSPLFEPWQNSGETYYKIRQQAIAPRHFLESADMGTIAVRYVIIPVTAERTRVKIDAVYVEAARKIFHASDGTVEKSEMKEVKEALDSMQQAAAEAADARRRTISAELVRQSYQRQRQDESTRLNNAQADAKRMEQEIVELRHELERRVKAPGADLKAAPFRAAANLKTLAAYTELVILIVTPHWLGVETPEGQRGWLPIEQMEPLP
ncbi:MAG TPA: hypothetical protein VEI54_05575 [Candidatus Limnocylindrales bacterium]|nr:hypothetical protein [Candidatus Limnocylindrales bacterium]